MQALREYNGDKLIVTLDPEDAAPLALEVGYRLARARVLMSRASGDGIDAAAVHDTVQRALGAMEEVRKIKSQLTGAKTKIDDAAGIVDAMALRVRGHLGEIDQLVLSAGSVEEPDEPEEEQPELQLD
jgi:NAD(P)-dependent dehydrogenase (short-subunit alcohol dehydrogenase family)